MDVLLGIAGALLAVAAVLTVIRIVRGPGPSDRVVATDVLISSVVGALVIEAALHRHPFTIPVILVLSLLAFAGTVSMARFVAGRADVFGVDPAAVGAAQLERDAGAPARRDDDDGESSAGEERS